MTGSCEQKAGPRLEQMLQPGHLLRGGWSPSAGGSPCFSGTRGSDAPLQCRAQDGSSCWQVDAACDEDLLSETLPAPQECADCGPKPVRAEMPAPSPKVKRS